MTGLRFISNLAFIGDFFVSESELFHSARIGLSNLELWKDSRPYDEGVPTKDSDGVLKTSITHSCPPSKKYYISAIEASIYFFNGFSSTSPDSATRSIKNEESILIIPRRKKEANWYLQTVLSLNILISSLSALPGTVDYISLRKKKSRIKTSSIHDPVVSAFGSSATANEVKSFSAHDVIVSSPIITHRTKHILNCWFQRSDSSKTAAIMLHSIRLRKPTMDIGLLIRVQAFEAWMQGRPNTAYISKAAYRKIRKKMLEAAELPDNEQFLQSLMNSLNFGNEKSLSEKLKGVTEDMNEVLASRILCMDIDEFCSQVASTRNYMAHRPKKTTKNVRKSGKPLYDLCDSLEWFMWYLVVSEIGVPESVLNKAVTKHSRISAHRRGRMESSAEVN
jgi:hypothetical protein